VIYYIVHIVYIAYIKYCIYSTYIYIYIYIYISRSREVASAAESAFVKVIDIIYCRQMNRLVCVGTRVDGWDSNGRQRESSASVCGSHRLVAKF